jgi:hypothetical protein
MFQGFTHVWANVSRNFGKELTEQRFGQRYFPPYGSGFTHLWANVSRNFGKELTEQRFGQH